MLFPPFPVIWHHCNTEKQKIQFPATLFDKKSAGFSGGYEAFSAPHRQMAVFMIY